MCNASGDSAGIYKGGMFYFTIANINRKHYSNLKNIYLIAVSHSEDFKAFGYNSVLQLIMIDYLCGATVVFWWYCSVHR
jgi:hypothetical protein